MISLFSGKKYSVKYEGTRYVYLNAKTNYAKGSKVRLCMPTDPSENIYLQIDSNDIPPVKGDKEGYSYYEFTMPDRDIYVSYYKKDEKEEFIQHTLLADVFIKIAGTEIDTGYEEAVLYSCDDSHLLLVKHIKDIEKNVTETKYLVPVSVRDEVYSIIQDSDIIKWKYRENDSPVSGLAASCKFIYNGDYVRLTVDDIPEKELHFFSDIKNLMYSYMKDEYLKKE